MMAGEWPTPIPTQEGSSKAVTGLHPKSSFLVPASVTRPCWEKSHAQNTLLCLQHWQPLISCEVMTVREGCELI